MTSVTIPDSVNSIGESIFVGCTALTSITTPFLGSTKDATEKEEVRLGYLFNGCDSYDFDPDPWSRYYNVIPESLKTVTVTGGNIGEAAFINCRGLTSVAIPDGVTSIGIQAFYGCSSLTSVTIPDGVTSIGIQTFFDCSSLTSVIIPDGVTSIGGLAFAGCMGLTSVTIPDSVTSISFEAFAGCTGLTSVYYQRPLEEYTLIIDHPYRLYIRNGTEYVEPTSATLTLTCYQDPDWGNFNIMTPFVDNVLSIKEITIPYESDVSSVDISDMPSLEKLNLEYFEDEIEVSNVPADVQVVYGYNCKSGTLNGFDYAIRGGIAVLTAYNGTAEQVILPTETEGAAVTKLGALFKGNTTVKEVIIPEGYTEIADEAFYGCTALQLLYIPSTITKMGQNVLCDNNMPVYFGNTTIAGQLRLAPYAIYSGFESAPSGWPAWYDKAYITHYNSKFDVASSMIYEETGDGIEITRYCGTAENVAVPAQINGTPVISVGGDGAFFERTYVKEVTLPEGITAIGQVAFVGAGLTRITVPEGVTSISPFAFYGCTALADISLPQSLGQIGQEAFENCTSLTSVTIPAGVYSIAYYAFKGCSALSSVTFEGTDGWILLEMEQDGNAIVPTEKTATPDLSDPSVNADYLKNTYLFWVWMNQGRIPA